MTLFYLIAKDNDAMTFSFEGTSTDDTDFNHSICMEQEKGRNVTCEVISIERKTKQDIVNSFEKRGYKLSQTSIFK